MNNININQQLNQNQNKDSSYIALKRTNFHQQIRRNNLEKKFKEQRMKFTIMISQSLRNNLRQNNQENQGNQAFSSLPILNNQDLDSYLQIDSCQIHDFKRIYNYLKNTQKQINRQNHHQIKRQEKNTFKNQQLSLSTQQKLLNLIYNKPSYLKDQMGIGTLGNLLLHADFNVDLLSQQMVQFFVQNIIQSNIIYVKPQDTHQNENLNSNYVYSYHFIDYLQTILWFLYLLVSKVQQTQLFTPLFKYLPMIERQLHQDPLNYPFLVFLSILSTNKNLLPSSNYITHLLSKSLTTISNGNQIQVQTQNFLVFLIDNYLRYNLDSQNTQNRFEKEQNFFLLDVYVKFITHRVKHLKYPTKLKNQLIHLYQTILNSSSDQLIERIFQKFQCRELVQNIFYRCLYCDSQYQFQQQSYSNTFLLSSYHCFLTVIYRVPSIIQQIINPSQIVSLLTFSLTWPIFKSIRGNILDSIQLLVLQDKNQRNQTETYKQLFLKQNIKKQIKLLMHQYLNINLNKYNVKKDQKDQQIIKMLEYLQTNYFKQQEKRSYINNNYMRKDNNNVKINQNMNNFNNMLSNYNDNEILLQDYVYQGNKANQQYLKNNNNNMKNNNNIHNIIEWQI